MSVKFTDSGRAADFTIGADGAMNTEGSAYLVVVVNSAGNVEAATSATSPFVGVTRGPAMTAEAGSAIEVRQTGVVTVRAHATGIAAGDSLQPAANGRVAKKGTAAATDRLVAIEAGGAVGNTFLAVLR